MPLPPYGTVLDVRPEILDPRGLLDMIDLGLVSDGRPRGLAAKAPGVDVLRDPSAFFAITYPSVEIVETLRTLARRAAAPESVPGTILLSGRYGQGKSHVLLAAHHALKAPDVARAWAARWGLGDLTLPQDNLVVTRSFIQHADEPLWDMLLRALSSAGRKPKVGDFPDGERIESLLGDRPVFVIMDELERWYDAQDELAQSRNRNFLQALTEVSMRDGRVTMVTSVLGEKQEPAETIRRVRPLELSFRSAEDRQRVVLFRLFSNRDEPAPKQAAEAAADAYVSAWTDAGIRGVDGARARLVATWPFTPEFIDILTKKIPNLGGFQNTRGTLRFLAHVVRATYTRRPVVSSRDLPFREDAIHQALTNLDTSGGEVVRRALGDNYEAAPADLPHRDELFSTLVFYSIADPTHPGATLDEVLMATLDPGEIALRLRDALTRLKQHAFNLHERDERFVFLAVENPHARINAMAGSQLVTSQVAREHVADALRHVWSGRERTAIHTDDWETTAKRLREIRPHRPRILLATTTLLPKERLRLQNLDEDRNLVLLVEPRVHTSAGDVGYSLLGDEVLLRHARRYEACKLLLEGRPAEEAAEVYRHVRDDELARLRKAVIERYGVAIAWHRAGATGSAVDDSWYDVCRLDDPRADGLLTLWRTDLTGQPDIEDHIRRGWAEFKNRTVRELATWFDRTPGVPVPLEAGWVPAAVRKLAEAGVLGLVAADGTPLPPRRAAVLDDASLGTCTIADPSALPPPPKEPEAGIVHPRVAAQYDVAGRGVLLSWAFPPRPEAGGSFATLVQRYTSARSWKIGDSYPVDAGQTHDANRYHGPEESFVDSERLQPGEWYHYYVFLVHTRIDGASVYTLSQRCDIAIPHVTPTAPGILETGIHPDSTKLLAEVERLVMSGKHMSSDGLVRKIEVRVSGVTAGAIKEHLAGKLTDRAADLEASADITFAARGAFKRQDVLALLRLLPKHDGASYAATLHLQGDGSVAPTRR